MDTDGGGLVEVRLVSYVYWNAGSQQWPPFEPAWGRLAEWLRQESLEKVLYASKCCACCCISTVS